MYIYIYIVFRPYECISLNCSLTCLKPIIKEWAMTSLGCDLLQLMGICTDNWTRLLRNWPSTEYMRTSLGRRDGLISAQVTTWRVLRSAHPAVPNDAVCIFSCEYLSETAKSNWAVKRIYLSIGESARWADLTIRLVVKANSRSARIDKQAHCIII